MDDKQQTNIGLAGMCEGYDQPSDPPSYSQVTKVPVAQPGYNPGQQVVATPYPPQAVPYVVAAAPPAAPQPQPVSINNVVVGGGGPSTTVVLAHNDYLCWSIFSCLCCFWPLGLVAIIFSVLSRDDATCGRIEGARRNARIALWLNIGSIIVVILAVIIAVVIYVTAGQEDDYDGY